MDYEIVVKYLSEHHRRIFINGDDFRDVWYTGNEWLIFIDHVNPPEHKMDELKRATGRFPLLEQAVASALSSWGCS